MGHRSIHSRRATASALLLLGAAMAAAGPRADWPAVGRFDRKGIYHPTPERLRFARLHGMETTKPQYPIVLVHGQGGFVRLRIGPAFGDYFNGVGRVYRRDGITYHATQTDPLGKIAERAQQLKEQLLELGYEKVNLVCHSMGGLDSRYMVTHLGMADRVASITTVATPHHGSWYADWVLKWVFEKQRFWKIWKLLGLKLDSVRDLQVSYMENEFNPNTPDMPQVRYFSIGGNQGYFGTILPFKGAKLVMQIIEKRAAGRDLGWAERLAERALFPKAMRRAWKRDRAGVLGTFGTDASWVVPEEAGDNDCMVSTSSARWGEYLGTLNADHFDQPGWFGSFRAPRFYRGIAHMLADAGY